jgi:hypothetical protein
VRRLIGPPRSVINPISPARRSLLNFASHTVGQPPDLTVGGMPLFTCLTGTLSQLSTSPIAPLALFLDCKKGRMGQVDVSNTQQNRWHVCQLTLAGWHATVFQRFKPS